MSDADLWFWEKCPVCGSGFELWFGTGNGEEVEVSCGHCKHKFKATLTLQVNLEPID